MTAPVCQPQRPGGQGHQGWPPAHASTPPSPSHAPTPKDTPQISINLEGLSFTHVAMHVGGGDCCETLLAAQTLAELAQTLAELAQTRAELL